MFFQIMLYFLGVFFWYNMEMKNDDKNEQMVSEFTSGIGATATSWACTPKPGFERNMRNGWKSVSAGHLFNSFITPLREERE